MNDSRNGTEFENETEKDYDIGSKILQSTAYAVVLVLSLAGNSTVLTIIKKNLNGSRKVVTNLVMTHMALADLVTTICGLPIMIWRIWRGHEWIADGTLGKLLCKMDVFIIETAFAVSAFAIALIALERYFVVFYPTRKILTCSRAFSVVLYAWIISAIFYSPKLYTMTIVQHQNIYVCAAHDRLIKPWRTIEVVLYIILLLVTFALYLAIIIKVSYYNRSTTPTTRHDRHRKVARRKMNRRVLCQSLVIILVHYICWAPYLLVYLSCFFSKNTLRLCRTKILIQFLVFFFAYSNAAANPFVYATLSENLRTGFKLLIYRLLTHRDDEKVRPFDRNQVQLRIEHDGFPQTLRANGSVKNSSPCSGQCDPPKRETKFEMIEMEILRPQIAFEAQREER